MEKRAGRALPPCINAASALHNNLSFHLEIARATLQSAVLCLSARPVKTRNVPPKVQARGSGTEFHLQDVRIEIVVPRLPLLVSELIPNAVEEQLKLLLRLTVRHLAAFKHGCLFGSKCPQASLNGRYLAPSHGDACWTAWGVPEQCTLAATHSVTSISARSPTLAYM